MALTRSMLKGMNLTEEQISAIIDAHKDTVDALKAQRDAYKADAEKLGDVQKELEGIKQGKDWKAEYEKLEKSFKDYKTAVADKETLASKRRMYRGLLDELKINPEDAELIMAGTDFGAVALGDDGKLSDADGLKKTIGEKYKRYIPDVGIKGAPVDTPPRGGNDGGANPRAAQLAKQFHERRYGVGSAPAKNENE